MIVLILALIGSFFAFFLILFNLSTYSISLQIESSSQFLIWMENDVAETAHVPQSSSDVKVHTRLLM